MLLSKSGHFIGQKAGWEWDGADFRTNGGFDALKLIVMP